MRRAGRRQLTFVFADSPKGAGLAESSDVSEAKRRLLHTANVKEAHEPAT